MRVFRVAHHTITGKVAGRSFPQGPYTLESDDPSKDRVRSILEHTQWDAHHPAPFEDPHLWTIHAYEVCGFVSEAALLDWFAGCLKGLDEVGFRLWVYEVPDDEVRVGSKAGQLLFRASAAEWVSMSRFPLDPAQLALFDVEGTSSPDQG